MRAELFFLFIWLNLAFGGDTQSSNSQQVPQGFENLRSQQRISLVGLQDKLERCLETSEPTKKHLLNGAAVLKDLIARADNPFDQRAITALKDILDHLVAFSVPDPELYLRELERVQQNAPPDYQGHDHRRFAMGIVLASIAHGMTQRAQPDEKAVWYYVAGEAQFAATKSGTKDFEEFLKLASSKEQDRISNARARLKTIKTLDRDR